MRFEKVMPENYVLFEVFDDFVLAGAATLRASTDKKLIFSCGKKLAKAKKDNPNFRYLILVYDNVTGEPTGQFEFKRDKGAFVSIELKNSSK